MHRRHFLTSMIATCACATQAQAQTDKLGTSRIMQVGTANGALIGLKSYKQTLNLADKEIILTFDDGPYAGLTTSVLNSLAAEQVRATFFLIGRNAAVNPDLVRRIADEGHTVAYHSQTHPMTLATMPEDAARANIEAGFASVDKAQGLNGRLPQTPFFRYPGFGDSPALNAWLASRNIAVFGTDIWANDWVEMSAHTQLNLLMGRIRKAGRGIVLLHDPRLQTVQMLPAFLRSLKEEGYRIVHIVPGSGSTLLRAADAGWKSETERYIAKRPPKSEWPKSNMNDVKPILRE